LRPLEDLPLEVQLQLAQRTRADLRDIRKRFMRSRRISASSFNANSYDSCSSLRNFLFTMPEIGILVPIFGYQRHATKRSGYVCDAFEAVCVVLRRLASPCRLADLEEIFGRHSSALSEIFWECAETFVSKQRHHLTEFKHNFLRSRSHIYAKAISDHSAPLNNCVGFIDCTKIKMKRLGGRGSNQRANYSGHKRSHCFFTKQ
jgi:hypothetical protein